MYTSEQKPPSKDNDAEKEKGKDDQDEDPNLLPGETKEERQAKLQRSFRKQVDRNVKDLKKGAVFAD